MPIEDAIAASSLGLPISRFRVWLQGRGARKRERIGSVQLEELSDHLLRDMGLTRDGVRHVVRHGRDR